jgi:hypothetical protein
MSISLSASGHVYPASARHYSRRTEAGLHVLNRGPAAVRSQADRMFGL